MSKVVIEIVDCGTKYVSKLAKPYREQVWCFSNSAELAWRFDSLEEAESIWTQEFPQYAPDQEGIYARLAPTYFEVST